MEKYQWSEVSELTVELADTRDKLSKAQFELSEARNDISYANCRINNLLDKVDKLDREIIEAKSGLSISEVEKNSLHEANQTLEAKNNECIKQITEHKKEMETIIENLEDEKNTVSKLKQELSDKNNTVEQMKKDKQEESGKLSRNIKIISNNQYAKILREKEAKSNEYNKQITEQKKEMETMIENLEDEKNTVLKLKQEISDKNDAVEQMVKEKQEESEKLSSNIQHLNNHYAKILREKEAKNNEFSIQILEHKKEMETMIENLDAVKNTAIELKQELSVKIDTIEQIEKEKQEVSEKSAKIILDLKIQNIETLRIKDEEYAVAFRNLHDDHELSIQKLNLDLTEAKDELKAEKFGKEETMKRLREKDLKVINEKIAELNGVEEQLKMKTGELEKTLRKKDEEHKIAFRKLYDDHELSVQNLNLDLTKANKLREDNLAKITDLEEKLSNKQNILEKMSDTQNLVKELKTHISILEEEINHNNNCWVKVNSLVLEMDKAREDILEEKINNAKLCQELSNANQKNNDVVANQEINEKKISLLQKKVESLQAIDKLNETNSKENLKIIGDDIKAAIKNSLASHKMEDHECEIQNDQNKKEITELKTKLNDLEQQVIDHKETETNLKTKIELKNKHIDELERKLRFSDNRVDNLNNEIATKRELIKSSKVNTLIGEDRAGAFQVMPSTRLVNQNDYLEMAEKLAELQGAYQALEHILEDKDDQICKLKEKIENVNEQHNEVTYLYNQQFHV